jgi:hypothetical protein
MGICGRLRYLLDSGDLAPAGEADALALLCRCAHTSLSCASDVARTPHLLASLRTLLQARSPARPTLRLVLTLLQLLCAASRGLASLVLQAGTLHCCHATLAGAFRVDIVSGTIAAPRQPLPAGDPTAAGAALDILVAAGERDANVLIWAAALAEEVVEIAEAFDSFSRIGTALSQRFHLIDQFHVESVAFVGGFQGGGVEQHLLFRNRGAEEILADGCHFLSEVGCDLH